MKIKIPDNDFFVSYFKIGYSLLTKLVTVFWIACETLFNLAKKSDASDGRNATQF
jgi:hypothetical protein